MNEIRKKRMEALILRELSGLIIRRRVKDERLGLVSISRIDLYPDLSRVTAFISLFGSDSDNRQTWYALLDNASFFQSAIGKNLKLRVTPKLWYEIDKTIAEGDRILQIIESGAK
jgi:ribosome-binding factor A